MMHQVLEGTAGVVMTENMDPVYLFESSQICIPMQAAVNHMAALNSINRQVAVAFFKHGAIEPPDVKTLGDFESIQVALANRRVDGSENSSKWLDLVSLGAKANIYKISL